MNTRKLFVRLLLTSAAACAFIISVGFASHSQSNMPCSGIVVKIDDEHANAFVEESDIRQMVQNKFGSLVGSPISSINISLLEKIINTNPFISDAEVFSTIDGKIVIEVKQRIPVLRVMNYSNETFYIDKDGVFMPSSDKFTARVPVASGFIFDTEKEKAVRMSSIVNTADTTEKSATEKLFNIISFVRGNEFWNSEVQQLYVNAAGEIEMIPRVGSHSVILGDDKYLDEKFKKLLAFYKEGLNKDRKSVV